MTDQPKPGSVAWLRENALFACELCDVATPHGDLRKFDGDTGCRSCFEEVSSGLWSDLPPFDPFARQEEAERLLREVVESGGYGMPVGLWGEIRNWASRDLSDLDLEGRG